MKETDLYKPIALYLQKQGYAVNSEVKNCDITVRKEDELILVEMKTRFSLALVYQAVDRKKVSPAVYVAIPVEGSGKAPPNYRSMKALLRRLEVGLIFVRFLKRSTRVEVVLHPRPYVEKIARRRRQMILREIDGRYGEFNRGGSTVADEKISTYRQEAIRIGWHLQNNGPLSPAQLKKLGCGTKTQRILADNHYGWFNRIGRGLYELDRSGSEALSRYERVTSLLENSPD